MVSLKELLSSIEIIDAIHPKDIQISGLSYHSKKCSDGHVFVCINGYQTDGHKYLANAVQNGAAAAIVEQFQEHIDIPQFRVANSRIALAQLGAAFYSYPAEKMKMIGITATNGKTSTSYMANEILEKHGLRTGLIGTVVIKIDDHSIPSELTTPESLDLQHYLKQMVDKDVSHVCMEVSSAAQETHRVETIAYDIVTMNNLSREHIDSHGTFERYWEAKSRLIRHAGSDSVAILNLDDEYSASLIHETAAQVVTFGLKNREGHFYCKDLDLTTGRAKFKFEIIKPFQVQQMEFKPGEFTLELAVPGLHSVYNSMVAAIIGLLCGASPETIQQAFKEFGGVERRFEFIYEDEFTIVDDHFANPGNINVTLETVKYMEYEQMRLLYAIRGNRGVTVNRENAEAIVEWMKKLEISELSATRSVSHVTAKDTVTDDEVDAFMEVMNNAGIEVRLFDELPDAITDTLSHAKRGDLILLAGCQGMDPGAEIVHQLLNTQQVQP